MANSTTLRIENDNSGPHIVKNRSCKWKTIGFAIAIILVLSALVMAGVGLGGYLQTGSLSNLSQVIIMVAGGVGAVVGGGGGIIFLIVWIISSVKNCKTNSPHRNNIADIIKSVDTQGGLVYGADAYMIWDMEVVESVPAPPIIDWDAKDPHFKEAYRENYVLLYIPNKVRLNNQEKDFDLKTFKEINEDSFSFFSSLIIKEFGDSKAPGWVLVSKKVLPNSRGKDFETRKKVIENSGFHMLHLLEAIVLNLMVDAFTEEKVHGCRPLTYNRCIENIEGSYSVFVGGFDSNGLRVATHHFGERNAGISVARREL